MSAVASCCMASTPPRERVERCRDLVSYDAAVTCRSWSLRACTHSTTSACSTCWTSRSTWTSPTRSSSPGAWLCAHDPSVCMEAPRAEV
eukprot:356567-Chlamydomonas_euryale.AAC.7